MAEATHHGALPEVLPASKAYLKGHLQETCCVTHTRRAPVPPGWLLSESSLLIITLLPEQLSCERIPGYIRIWWLLAPRALDVQKVSLRVKSQGIPGHNESCFFPPRRRPTQNCTNFGFEVEFGQSKLVKGFAFSFRIKLPWMSFASPGHVLP